MKKIIYILITLIASIFVIGYLYNNGSKTVSAPDQPLEYTMATSSKGYNYPVITYFPNKPVMDKINSVLKKQFEEYGCPEDVVTDEGTDFSAYAEVEFNLKNIFSTQGSTDYYCGGAHPDAFATNKTFDMNTGQEVTFPDLFVNYEANKDRIISTIFKTKIVAANEPKNKDDECTQRYAHDELLNTFGFDYYISKEGELMVQPQFPHVSSGCEEYVPVRKEDVKNLYPSDFLKRLE